MTTLQLRRDFGNGITHLYVDRHLVATIHQGMEAVAKAALPSAQRRIAEEEEAVAEIARLQDVVADREARISELELMLATPAAEEPARPEPAAAPETEPPTPPPGADFMVSRDSEAEAEEPTPTTTDEE